MKAKKYDKTGKLVGEVDLPASVFDGEVNVTVIHTAMRTEQRNRRQGSRSVKGFSDVSGGGKKPWGQKHTGNARQGSTRAPQWRHGATVHGPKPRDFRVKLNKDLRNLALSSILVKKGGQGAISIMEDMGLTEFSTKTVYSALKKTGLIPGSRIAFVADTDDLKLKKSMGNIPVVNFIHVRRLTVPELYNSGHVLIADSALKYIADHYGRK
ncbi:MAG: 50S ribosomal protein L4 [Spirochaetia bacterium]|nr:50S ribosomal protein L4 [Spirochaetia bacterium]